MHSCMMLSVNSVVYVSDNIAKSLSPSLSRSHNIIFQTQTSTTFATPGSQDSEQIAHCIVAIGEVPVVSLTQKP